MGKVAKFQERIVNAAHVLGAVIRYPSRLPTLLPVLLVLPRLFMTAPVYGDEVSAHNNENPAVYIAGYESDGDTDTPCYWLNDVQYMFPVTGSGGSAYAVAVSGSDVYIAGYEYNAENNLAPCYWLNGVQYMLPVTVEATGKALAITPRNQYRKEVE